MLVLLTNAYVRNVAMRRVIEDNALVQHSQHVLFQAEHVKNLMVDAETGQRGYLYTDDPQYLEPYDTARKDIDSEIDQLRQLTKASPEQQSRVDRLGELAHEKLQELGKTIQLHQAGKLPEARALVKSNVGKSTMDEFRRVLDDISGFETQLQTERLATTHRSTQQAFLAFILATTVGCCSLLIFGWLLAREMRRSHAAAAEVLQQKEWLGTTLHSIGDAVIATDAEGNVVFLNDVAVSLTGYSKDEARGLSLKQVFPIFNESTLQPVEDPVEKVIRMGTVVGLANHTVLRRRDGSKVAIDDSAAPIRNPEGELTGVVLVFRDVSKQRETDIALRNAEKLASAGRFAATIAHEINNPLEAVMNSLFLLNSDPGLTPEGRIYLRTAEQELTRVAAVARQTLSFYKDTTSHSQVSVPELLDEILALYSKRVDSRSVEIVRNYAHAPELQTSAGELRQVFSNVILNSLDALPTGGTLALTVKQEVQEEGEYVRVDITDNGVGIPPENLKRIFEPFFTTKADVGTGLGLWSAKSLVEKHGGQMLVESSRDTTRFTVLLPCRGASQSASGHAIAS